MRPISVWDKPNDERLRMFIHYLDEVKGYL